VKSEFIGTDLSDPKVFAMAQYQPNTLETHFKVLFSVFKKEQIHYQMQKDFNGPGDFHAYWKDAMAVAAEHRPLILLGNLTRLCPTCARGEKLSAHLEDGT
jgi:hypothetical protein